MVKCFLQLLTTKFKKFSREFVHFRNLAVLQLLYGLSSNGGRTACSSALMLSNQFVNALTFSPFKKASMFSHNLTATTALSVNRFYSWPFHMTGNYTVFLRALLTVSLKSRTSFCSILFAASVNDTLIILLSSSAVNSFLGCSLFLVPLSILPSTRH